MEQNVRKLMSAKFLNVVYGILEIFGTASFIGIITGKKLWLKYKFNFRRCHQNIWSKPKVLSLLRYYFTVVL